MTSTNLNRSEIDEFDRDILDLLQNDAKITIKEISDKVGKSPTAIRSRIVRLEEKYIKKYIALIDCRQLGYREMVMASLRVNSSEPLERIKGHIEGMEKIKFAYIVTGEYPLFIMAKCMDHEDSMGLIEKLRNLPGVEEIKTQIVLDRIKEDTTIIIP
ncbi:Leucine-responsive regulatory protein [subsurface metagenome]